MSTGVVYALCRSSRLELHAMPALDIVGEDLIDELVLLDHRQPREARRDDVERVHGAAAAADVLDLVVVACQRALCSGLRTGERSLR